MLKIESQSWMIVLYEGEGSAPLDGNLRFELMRSLSDRGYSVTRAARSSKGEAIGVGPRTAERLLVLGAFPLGVPLMEDSAGKVAIETHDVRPWMLLESLASSNPGVAVAQ